MKAVLIASSLASVLVMGTALPTYAATMSCTSPSCSFSDEGALDPAGDSFQFGRSHPNQLPSTAGTKFSDYYSFSISPMQSAFDGSFTLSGTKAAQFPTDVVATLYEGTATFAANTVTTGASTNLGSFVAGGRFDIDLGAGSYYLFVSGTTGTKGGNYSGTASLSTVPLPASAPMFGAALVALGAAGYGLKRKGKAAA